MSNTFKDFNTDLEDLLNKKELSSNLMKLLNIGSNMNYDLMSLLIELKEILSNRDPRINNYELLSNNIANLDNLGNCIIKNQNKLTKISTNLTNFYDEMIKKEFFNNLKPSESKKRKITELKTVKKSSKRSRRSQTPVKKSRRSRTPERRSRKSRTPERRSRRSRTPERRSRRSRTPERRLRRLTTTDLMKGKSKKDSPKCDKDSPKYVKKFSYNDKDFSQSLPPKFRSLSNYKLKSESSKSNVKVKNNITSKSILKIPLRISPLPINKQPNNVSQTLSKPLKGTIVEVKKRVNKYDVCRMYITGWLVKGDDNKIIGYHIKY